MADILVNEDDPAVFSNQVTQDELDIDHIVISLPVNRDGTEALMNSLVGNAVTLATIKGRTWHQEQWNYMVLAWHPFIILTTRSHVVRQELCTFFCHNGHVVLPSGDESTYLIQGHAKPIPLSTFLSALVDVGVSYIRVINFGMKQHVQDL
jgi:hypothetical protein